MSPDARSTTVDDLLAHGPWVRALARSLVADSNLADDIEQETWADAIERPPARRGNLRAWLARVVRRRLLDHRRGERRRLTREAGASASEAQGDTPADVVARAEMCARIAQEVMRLEEPYRRTMLLRWFDERSAAQIATLMGVPLATVRTRLQRGLERLRERVVVLEGSDPASRRRALLLLAAVADGGSRPMPVAATAAVAVAACAVVVGGVFVVSTSDLLRSDDARTLPAVAASESPGDAASRHGRDANPPSLAVAPRSVPRQDGAQPIAAPSSAPAEAPGHVGSRVAALGGNSVPGARSIAGTVVDERTGRPVPEMPVRLVTRAGERPATTFTGDDGSFRLAGPAEGTSSLVAGIEGGDARGPAGEYVPREAGPFDAGTTDARIEVAKGQAISGEIRGPDGGPWKGRTLVRAHPVSSDGVVDYSHVRLVLVEGSGDFRVPGLAPGAYDLTVEAPGDGGGVARVGRVAAGATGVVARLERGVALSGRLVDEAGEPVVATGWIWVGEVGVKPGAPGSITARLGEGGRFQTPPLDPGRAYFVHATGFAGYGGADLLGVHPGDAELVLRLPRGERIVGRVINERGEPVGALVPVTCASEFATVPPAEGDFVYVTTDATGSFTAGGLHKGRWRLAAGGGVSGWLSTGIAEVAPSGSEPVTLRVARGAPFSGRLVDARGQPLAYVDLKARAEAGQTGSVATARCDADGHFAFTGVPRGPIALAATVRGTWTQLGRFEAPGTDVTVTAPP